MWRVNLINCIVSVQSITCSFLPHWVIKMFQQMLSRFSLRFIALICEICISARYPLLWSIHVLSLWTYLVQIITWIHTSDTRNTAQTRRILNNCLSLLFVLYVLGANRKTAQAILVLQFPVTLCITCTFIQSLLHHL